MSPGKIVLLTFALMMLVSDRISSQAKAEYTHWSLAHILSDYEEAPIYDAYITGGPVIEQLDSLGGILIFYLTPQVNRDCRQAFRVGWQFGQPVQDLEEGNTVGVTVFSYPMMDTVKGMLDCYHSAKEALNDDEGVKIRFMGGNSPGLASQRELAFYWEQSSPDLFRVDQVAEAASGSDRSPGSGSFIVGDLDQDPSGASIAFGTFTLEIWKEGAFSFRILYLFDGKESDISPAGTHRLLLDKLMVEHSVTGSSGAPVMNISLAGLLEQAVGHRVQIIVHFLDQYRRPLPGIEGDTVFCDPAGNVFAYSPQVSIASRQFYLNELVITVPYYALNLPSSRSGHALYLYAEVILDGKAIGGSKLSSTNFFW